MIFAKGRMQFYFLVVVVCTQTWSMALADEVRLRVRSVPSDVTVWRDGQQIPRDPKDGTYLLNGDAESVTLELKAVGYRSETLQLQLEPEQTLVSLPDDKGRIIYLQPMVKEVRFHTSPTSLVYLQTGQDKQFLGDSSQPLVVPLGAGSGVPLLFIFEAAGYRRATLEMNRAEFQADRLPADGVLELRPSIPLVAPVLKWLSARKALSAIILVLLSLGILILVRKLILGRARSGQ